MSSFVGVLVSDQWLQSQFTQVELRTLKSKVSVLCPPLGLVCYVFFNMRISGSNVGCVVFILVCIGKD